MSLADKLTEVAENVPKVYAAGESHGITIGRDEASAEYDAAISEVNDSLEGVLYGIAEGGKSHYDAFWDAYQQNGTRTQYDFAFAGDGWNDNTFKPKYDIIPSWNIVNMFYKSDVTDLDALLKKCGVKLDISDNGNYGEVFNGSAVTVLPELEFGASARSIWRTFADCKALHTIKQLTFNEAIDASRSFNDIFTNDTALANVEFAGVLKGNINFQWCPLTLESAKSLISILKDYSGTSTADTKTVTFSSTTVALLNEAGAIFNGQTWQDYLLSIGWSY